MCNAVGNETKQVEVNCVDEEDLHEAVVDEVVPGESGANPITIPSSPLKENDAKNKPGPGRNFSLLSTLLSAGSDEEEDIIDLGPGLGKAELEDTCGHTGTESAVEITSSEHFAVTDSTQFM